MKFARLIALTAVLCAAFAALAGSAQAGTIYTFSIDLDPTGVDYALPGGSARVFDLDSTKDTRVIVAPPSGPNRYDQTHASGSTQFSANPVPGLAPGDTVIVRQPAASVAPTESFVIPPVSLNVTTGATVLTGSLPAGMQGAVSGDYRCDSAPMTRTISPGPFSLPYSKIIPGEIVYLDAYTATGDSVALFNSSGGETPCIDIDASGRVAPTPGATPNPTPFQVSVDHTILALAPSIRVVLRRGSTVLLDGSQDSNAASFDIATQPLPGDVVDVYRPKTAPSPSSSVTIPPISATFDPAADLVGVTAPAAGIIYASPCRHYACTTENIRALRNAPAGRTLLDFAHPQGFNRAVDLRADDYIFARYANPDFTFAYDTSATPGDLVAPVGSFKLSGKLKVSALLKGLKKGFKVKLKSNEAANAKLTLTMGKAKLATVTKHVNAGTTTIKLKFTKSGKKAIKKLAAAGKRAKPKKATLTAVLTDASGNAATTAKTTKIKR